MKILRNVITITLSIIGLFLISSCESSGVSGYEIVSNTVINSGPGNVVSPIATCPDGKRVLGGGGTTDVSTATGDNGVRVLGSFPVGDNAWQFVSTSTEAGSHKVTVYAICANVSP